MGSVFGSLRVAIRRSSCWSPVGNRGPGLVSDYPPRTCGICAAAAELLCSAVPGPDLIDSLEYRLDAGGTDRPAFLRRAPDRSARTSFLSRCELLVIRRPGSRICSVAGSPLAFCVSLASAVQLRGHASPPAPSVFVTPVRLYVAMSVSSAFQWSQLRRQCGYRFPRIGGL